MGMTLRQIDALLERHEEAMRFEDILHARTAQSIRGGKIEDILITPKEEKRVPNQMEVNQRIMAAFFAMGGEDLRAD